MLKNRPYSKLPRIVINGVTCMDYAKMTVHEVEEYIRERSFYNSSRGKTTKYWSK